MENEHENPVSEEVCEQPRYVKRPWWQVFGAWVGLILLAVVLVIYYLSLAKGGL